VQRDELAEQVAELQRRIDALEDRRVFEAERIDIVETDGTVRLAISTSAAGSSSVGDAWTMGMPPELRRCSTSSSRTR
jgi:hypothetical protein